MIIKKTTKGFTLMEILISMFIFSVIILASTTIFSKSISTYRNSSNIQENLENAQFALNSMAKMIREAEDVTRPTASSILLTRPTDPPSSYCYQFSGNSIEAGDCTPGGMTPIVNNVGNLRFFVREPSSAPGSEQVGLVTILIELCSDSACSKPDKMNLQTSASLRN